MRSHTKFYVNRTHIQSLNDLINSASAPSASSWGYSFVCLCAGYLKKFWTDPDEILWTGSVCDKDELIRCWWRSGSRSDCNNFFKRSFTIERLGQNLYIAQYLKSCGRIRTKLVGKVGCVARTNRFDFGEDLNPDLDTRII